ncbi:Peptidoglycan-binding domain 1 [Pseudoalteromonas luteoviolacea B = ATCC 29581]|nr:Peptidoglycan-binding domain 1 [Pseudoalteromonas luteoviolacea B = ATCC 29581]
MKKLSYGKGFSGLDSLYVDIDSFIANHKSKNTQNAQEHNCDKAQSTSSSQDTPSPKSNAKVYQSPNENTGNYNWVWWVLGIVFVLYLIGQNNSSSSKRTNTSSYSNSSSSSSSSRPSETKPPVGKNQVLSTSQIRYCLAESIRLEAAENLVNNNSQYQVDLYNNYVGDYNARCSEYRYRTSSMSSAKRYIDDYRATIRAEGRNRFN